MPVVVCLAAAAVVVDMAAMLGLCVEGLVGGEAGVVAGMGQQHMPGWAVLLLLLVLAAAGVLGSPVCWLQWLTCFATRWQQCHQHMVSGVELQFLLLVCFLLMLAFTAADTTHESCTCTRSYLLWMSSAQFACCIAISCCV
jgi:hypothetical protein